MLPRARRLARHGQHQPRHPPPVVTDIAASLADSEIHRLALVNGHGGNYVLGNIVQAAIGHGPGSRFPTGSRLGPRPPGRRMDTDAHEDMHAGELEVSILLATHPDVIRPGNETADWTADDRPHLLTLGMGAYTKSGVIGRPSWAPPPRAAPR